MRKGEEEEEEEEEEAQAHWGCLLGGLVDAERLQRSTSGRKAAVGWRSIHQPKIRPITMRYLTFGVSLVVMVSLVTCSSGVQAETTPLVAVKEDSLGTKPMPQQQMESRPSREHQERWLTAMDLLPSNASKSLADPPTNEATQQPALGNGTTTDERNKTTTEAPSPLPEIHGVPSNPTLVTANALDAKAEVSWKEPDDDGMDPILEYEIVWIDEANNEVAGSQTVHQVATASSSPPSAASSSESNHSSENVTSKLPIHTNNSTSRLPPTSVIISHLVNGHSYSFKVRAKNVNGFSTWSAKSLPVSPMHPSDLCARVSCSNHGTCFPVYHNAEQQSSSPPSNDTTRMPSIFLEESDETSFEREYGAKCVCRPGFNPPDCSVSNEQTQRFYWKVGEWRSCSAGCGGGKRTRDVQCYEVDTNARAPSEIDCKSLKKPASTGICNGMECGSKLVLVKYEVEMSYDEVLFNAEATEAFEEAFLTEMSAALQVPRTRLEISGLKRGSIVVLLQILSGSKPGDKSLNDIVEKLQDELGNSTSVLRTKGTFAKRVEPNGVKLSFSLADQTAAGGAEDISVGGLVGTVFVLVSFVSLFGCFLRARHRRLSMASAGKKGHSVVASSTSSSSRTDMKRMGIRTMA